MNQLDAFSPAPRFPRARGTDPASSHAAAVAIESTGAARAQAGAVLAALRQFDNCTTMELARHSGIDRYAIARRMPELAEVCLVERIEPTKDTVPCAVSGKRVLRWRVV